jgi:hypothetical protein
MASAGYATFLLFAAVLVLVPGPDFAVVVRNTLAGGLRRNLDAATGLALLGFGARLATERREIADAVRDLPGVTVVPDPPQTPMLHLLLRTGADEFATAAHALAESGLWTWERAARTADPAVQRGSCPSGTPRWPCRSGRSGRPSPHWRAEQPHLGGVCRRADAVLRSSLAHERQRQAPGWLPGNLNSV